MSEIQQRALGEIQNAIDQCEGVISAGNDDDGSWTMSLEAWKYAQKVVQMVGAPEPHVITTTSTQPSEPEPQEGEQVYCYPGNPDGHQEELITDPADAILGRDDG